MTEGTGHSPPGLAVWGGEGCLPSIEGKSGAVFHPEWGDTPPSLPPVHSKLTERHCGLIFLTTGLKRYTEPLWKIFKQARNFLFLRRSGLYFRGIS